MGIVGGAGFGAYNASKEAIRALTRTANTDDALRARIEKGESGSPAGSRAKNRHLARNPPFPFRDYM